MTRNIHESDFGELSQADKDAAVERLLLRNKRNEALERAARAYGEMKKRFLSPGQPYDPRTRDLSYGKYAVVVQTLKEEWGFKDEEIWAKARELGLE